ncbi:MAG: Spy/CpxP family protein refolding chaperone [Ferruginibacter sp.]
MKRIIALSIVFAAISFSATAQQQRDSQAKEGLEQGMQHKKHGKHGKAKIMKDLNLTDAQKTEMKKMREENKAKMEALKAQNLSTEEMQKQKAALKDANRTKMQNILTDEQKAKMEQKRVQMKDEKMKGGKMKGDRKAHFEKMKQDLNLSTEQAEKLKTLNQAVHGKIQAVRSNTSLTEEQKKTEIKAIKEASKAERKNILTDEQMKKMEQMKKEGKPHKMKKEGRKQTAS